MLETYFPILIFIVLGLVIGGVVIALGFLLGGVVGWNAVDLVKGRPHK